MSALAKGPLTVAETEFLGQCEDTIDAGLMTFVEVGQALVSIRDNRLYRAEFPTFEEYCAQRWQISRTRSYELMSAARVVSAIADTGTEPPANEAQARELARVPEPQRAEVWKQTLEATEGKPTAAAVRAAATEPPTDRPVDVAAPLAPPAPSAPSPMEKYLADSPALERTGWQTQFAKALAKSGDITTFTPERVAEYADRQLVDELRLLVTNLDDYAGRAEKAWNERHGGLRVIQGGAA